MKQGKMSLFARVLSYVMFGITAFILMYALGMSGGSSSAKDSFTSSFGMDSAISSMITIFRTVLFMLSAITSSLGVILHMLSAPIASVDKTIGEKFTGMYQKQNKQKQDSTPNELKI